ncbi:hypothetical protein GCM10025864_39600 [Luteimicrobium album]|uniref:Uncharacterized protein n=1 Tax=Luteimicrobium album TaxID=1054550 RepID=A0ABQ6I640_9MICO|nr:hypothetical protein [Luteimicrobium album]GMA26201.1 hypothetical protein GCM10025864_39600 [Luteimicrobium album]
MVLPIKRARSTFTFYPDMSVAQEIDRLEEAVAVAMQALETEKDKPQTLASKTVAQAQKKVDAARKAYDDACAAANSGALKLTLEALAQKRWAEAEEAHPAREGDDDDAVYAVNFDTFLGEVLPDSVIEVQDGAGERVAVSPDEWRQAVDEISNGQYRALLLSILALNRSAKQNPF